MEEREYHYQGKISRETDRQPEKITTCSKYRHVIEYHLPNGGDPTGSTSSYPRLSDEFLNEYIPENLSTSVLWKDVLACGMIPEQRGGGHFVEKQDYLREDIRYMNQCLPEAPSPAPAPTNMIVAAEPITKHSVSCEKEDDKIIVIYIDNENNDKYIFEIVTDSDFWKKYGMYFQNNLDKCYDVLMMAFTENNESVKWTIKEKNKKDIIINISCHVCDVFGFSVDMTLYSEEKYIEKLEKRVKELEKKVESKIKNFNELEDKVRSLCEYITYKETMVFCPHVGYDSNRDWEIPMEEPGSPKYNELSQTRSGYRKEIWAKVMEEKGWNITNYE
jgi:hypothetical protein